MEDRFQERGVGRSHAALPKISIPSRWNTFADNSSTSKLASDSTKTPTNGKTIERSSLHRSHLHRRPHRHHHTRDTIQSAVQLQNPFSFDNYNPLRRYEKHQHHRVTESLHNHSSSNSQEDSRRNSQTAGTPQHDGLNGEPIKHAESHDAVQPIKRIIRHEDILRERKRRERRGEEVAEALNALSRDAHTATRKLDDTYYALLERLGTLKSTITSLRELSASATQARTEWETEISIAGQEVEAKLQSFNGFKGQEKIVEDLVSRLKKGKTTAGGLEDRLEACRGRLERFQKKEQEDRKTVSKRWKICWVALSAMVLLLVGLVLWRRQRGQPALLEEMRRTGQMISERGAELAVEMGVVEGARFNKTKPGLRLVDKAWEREQAVEEKKWERVLDEL